MVFRRLTPPTPLKQAYRRGQSQHPRRDKGQPHLTQRDMAALRWIGEQYGIRMDMLRILLERLTMASATPHAVSLNATRQVVQRWHTAGLVETAKIVAFEAAWVYLSEKGIRFVCDRQVRMWRPTLATITHYGHVNRVRLALEARYPTYQWISERTLVQQRADRHTHCADGVLETPQDRIAVEVELTPISLITIEETLLALACEYARIWYFTSPHAHMRVMRALQHLTVDEQRHFQIYKLEEIE